MSDNDFNEIFNNMVKKELVVKHDEYNYYLTDKGEELYQFIKSKNPLMTKMLLGSAKINRIIIEKLEEML